MPSPAERYAAAAARSRRDRSELGRFTAGLDFKGDWTLLGGLQSASLTASASVDASVSPARLEACI